MCLPASELAPVDLALVDRFQRDLPLIPRPYQAMGKAIGISESSVIARLARHHASGIVSRVGAVFKPHSIGMSTLAAMAVPRQAVDSVATLVNGYPAINHNYEREHRYNLWFVAVGEDESAVESVLLDIESRTGLPVLRLPLLRDFHIDLGFSLAGTTKVGRRPARPVGMVGRQSLSTEEQQLVAALNPGLPFVSRPFREIARAIGSSENNVIGHLEAWLAAGIIRRLGVVVRHHELGYRANGMVVWDIDDSTLASAGRQLATFPWVTLCYQRPRRLPEWPYNLFTMVHGLNKAAVAAQVAQMAAEAKIEEAPRETLFSTRRFKQTGARYCAGSRSGLSESAANGPHHAGPSVSACTGSD